MSGTLLATDSPHSWMSYQLADDKARHGKPHPLCSQGSVEVWRPEGKRCVQHYMGYGGRSGHCG